MDNRKKNGVCTRRLRVQTTPSAIIFGLGLVKVQQNNKFKARSQLHHGPAGPDFHMPVFMIKCMWFLPISIDRS
jgi:hypothetical protein